MAVNMLVTVPCQLCGRPAPTKQAVWRGGVGWVHAKCPPLASWEKPMGTPTICGIPNCHWCTSNPYGRGKG